MERLLSNSKAIFNNNGSSSSRVCILQQYFDKGFPFFLCFTQDFTQGNFDKNLAEITSHPIHWTYGTTFWYNIRMIDTQFVLFD